MNPISMTHNSNASIGKTGVFIWENVDFSNIKSFKFKILSKTGTLTDSGFSLGSINSTSNNQLIYFLGYTVNQENNVDVSSINTCDFAFFVSHNDEITFKVISYTTTDGVVHTA